MLFGRRRRQGLSLVKLGVIFALLYFTGAGAWLWERTKQLPEACYDMIGGMNSISMACDGLASGIEAVDEGWESLKGTVREWFGQAKGQAGAGLEQFSNQFLGQLGGGQLSRLTSNGDGLEALMRRGPIVLPNSADAGEKLKAALDQFVIGQRQLQTGSVNDALPWFQQSAAQPGGYGVLSQLTLGDMYRSGSHGLPSNSESATHYYQQAQQSITQLQQSNTPESKQLLGNLPASPSVITQQISAILKSLKQ